MNIRQREEELYEMFDVPEEDRVKLRPLMQKIGEAGGLKADPEANEPTYIEIGRIMSPHIERSFRGNR